ncbi:MAG TPA: hypothetical protein PLM75_12750, partial [bacterium]|nr:hypothetical protein [bacterium]
MKYYKIIENINFILVLAIVSGSAIFISQHTNPAIEIKLYYAGILNAILTILSLIQIMLNDKLKKQNVFAPLIFGIILYFSATFFWSVAKPLSLRYLFIFITFALIYFNFSLQINSELKIKILLTFISLICTAVCLFGLLQFFGFDFYKWGRVYELFESPDILRVISSFGNPNFFGVYIIAVFPIILALNHLRFENNIYILANISLFLLFCASYFKIDFFYHDTDLTKINVEYLLSAIFIISLLIIFIIHRLLQIQTIKQFITNYLLPFINILFIAIITISLSLTYNRCAYLAFAAEIMLFYLLLKFYLKRKIISKIGIIYLCAVMIILIIIIFNSQTLKKPIISSWQRFVNITNTSQSDIKIRFDLWQVVLNT